MSEHGGGGQSQGPATDQHNEPVVDPTSNVFQLVDAAIKREDDLREAESRHLREIVLLRAEQRKTDIDHVVQMAALRSDYDDKLREAEAKRIDAIRAVDVGAVAAAAAVQTTQASTLAATVVSSAEALRNQVAAAQAQSDSKLSAALEPIQKDIADLRRVQYESVGQKAQVVEARAGTGSILGMVAGAVGILGLVVTVIVLLVSNPPA